MRDIIGHGGGKGSGSSHTHYEAPDSLHSTSYARVLDLVSEGEIVGLAEGLQSVYLNDTPIQNADGTSNFENVTVDFRAGTQTQDYIPGFPDVESETSVGVELKYGTPWVRAITNTQLSAVRITLGVDQLYKADTGNGDVGGTIVNYSIELSTDGGAYKTVLTNAFNGKTMSAYQRSARIDLPRATTGWQIRVSRLTANSTVVSVVDKTNIISFTEVLDAKLRYPMSAIVGIQVDAKAFQAVPTRAYDLLGRIIQVPSNYNPITRAYTGTWDGTFKPSWTDNPAWVFRDLVLHDRYGLGHRITAAQLDKWALYKIARYCDELVPDGKGGTEPRFTCNLYLQTRKQAYAVLQDIASIFRGISYWGAGTIMASADMPSDPVYVYTAANVIGGKFTRTGTKKSTRYTVALVTWNDPTDGYKQKTEYVEDREGIARYGIQQTELTAFGCTSQGQAHRAGLWALTTSRLETEGISFDVGMDGAIALPGQIVRIADPSRMGRRVGGRVRAVTGRTVTLDKAPTVKAGDRLTVMLPTGASETHVVTSVAGDAVTVDADWSTVPRAQAVWSVDSDELSAPLFRVLNVEEKDAVTFTITAVQHEPGKFDFVENGTAITPRPQTALDVTKQAPPTSVTVTGYTVSLNDVQKLALQVSCAPVAGAVAYEGAYRRGNDNWVAIPRQASPTMDVLDVLAGTYMAKMAAVNSIGVTSIETLSVAVEIAKDGASKNAKVDLSSDAPYFHTNQAGTTTPTVITFTADLTALDGPVDWACVGGTLTNKTGTTAQLTFANATAASVTVTASVTSFERTYSKDLKVGKLQDGAAGTDGLKTATVQLQQWASTAPAKPTGTSTFTWASLTNGAYTGNDGWSVSANNPGTPGLKLYIASAAISAAAAVTTSSVSYANATVAAWSQNGATGADGVQSGSATVYQWAATIPAGPVGSGTFKWSDASFGAAPTDWALTPGAAPSVGMTLWAARVQVTDSAASSETSFSWATAAIMAVGYSGSNGQQGASYVTAYIASSAIAANGAPAPTSGKASLPAANSSGLSGAWSATVPTLTDGQRMYQSDGIYDPATDKVTWSTPYWSSLKVATLSAITLGVMGNITSGSMDIGTGATSWHVDASGNQWAGAATYAAAPYRVSNTGAVVANNFTATAGDGTVLFQAGAGLTLAGAPLGTKNSEIKVGGRNLAQDSHFEGRLRPWSQKSSAVGACYLEGAAGSRNLFFDSGSTGDAYVDGGGLGIPVVPGRTYVISFDYATATTGTITASSTHFYTNAGGTVFLPFLPLNSGQASTRWESDPWLCPAGVTSLLPRFGFVATAYTWMRVYSFKVEEGTKGTAWTPAPEDVDAGIAAAATTADWTKVSGTGKPADNATVGAPAGTLVAGVAAATVATAAINFNSSNDRNGTAVTNPTIAVDGSSVDHVIRTDGAADISFEWLWSGNEGDIDGFLVYVYQSTSSAAYTFGTTPAAETVYTVPAAKRAFILFGAGSTMYTSFGVQAYRSVDKDISSTGVIRSSLVRPSVAAENPYRPSNSVAFTGDITGTINGMAASTLLSNVASAATTANWDGGISGRPSDSELLNSAIRVAGKNLAVDSAFEGGLRPWTQRSGGATNSIIEGSPGAKNLFIDGSGDIYVDGLGPNIPVTAGKQYVISFDYATATTGTITASSTFFYAAGGSPVAIPLPTLNTGQVRTRCEFPWTCPAGVTGLSPRFGISTTAYSWMRVWPFQVAEGNKDGGWSPAPEDMASSLADKLSKTSASQLAASVTLVTGGSILAGDTTNGSYHSPSGFYGVQGGVVKFSVPISGDPTFGGRLTAAYGSFGAVSIAAGGSLAIGQTAYDTGSGLWFGWVNGVPKMSIGAAGGSALLWDGNAITIRNPSMDAFTAYLTGSAGGSYANGSQGYGTLTVTTAGGRAPYRYQWVLSLIQKSGSAGNMVMNSATSQSASFSGSGTNATLDYAVSVVVTDANGRSYTLSTEIVANHGTPP